MQVKFSGNLCFALDLSLCSIMFSEFSIFPKHCIQWPLWVSLVTVFMQHSFFPSRALWIYMIGTWHTCSNPIFPGLLDPCWALVCLIESDTAYFGGVSLKHLSPLNLALLLRLSRCWPLKVQLYHLWFLLNDSSET